MLLNFGFAKCKLFTSVGVAGNSSEPNWKKLKIESILCLTISMNST